MVLCAPICPDKVSEHPNQTQFRVLDILWCTHRDALNMFSPRARVFVLQVNFGRFLGLFLRLGRPRDNWKMLHNATLSFHHYLSKNEKMAPIAVFVLPNMSLVAIYFHICPSVQRQYGWHRRSRQGATLGPGEGRWVSSLRTRGGSPLPTGLALRSSWLRLASVLGHSRRTSGCAHGHGPLPSPVTASP